MSIVDGDILQAGVQHNLLWLQSIYGTTPGDWFSMVVLHEAHSTVEVANVSTSHNGHIHGYQIHCLTALDNLLRTLIVLLELRSYLQRDRAAVILVLASEIVSIACVSPAQYTPSASCPQCILDHRCCRPNSPSSRILKRCPQRASAAL